MVAFACVVDELVQACAVGAGFPAELVLERLIAPTDDLVLPARVLIGAADSHVAEGLSEQGI
jgi:hypothetical protein